MKRAVPLFAPLLLALVAAPLAAQSLSPQEIASRARPATVLVRASANGQAIGQGSGFLVDPSGVLVSNLHVVEGADAITVTTASGEIYDKVFFVSADRRKDIVVLKIPGIGLPSLRFGDDQGLEVGDRVFVLGNPRGLEGTFSDGMISAKRIEDGVAYLQITAPISSGSSGGPVLNSRGEVVGIATATIRDGQNLNLAVASRYARGMIAMGERPRPLGEARSELARATPAASPPAPARPAGPPRNSGVGTVVAELQTWEREVVLKLLAVDEIYEDDGGWVTHGDALFGMLRRGGRDSQSVTLGPGTYKAVGVCDSDCTDLDLVAYTGSRRLDSDFQTDALPILNFTATARTAVRFEATLPGCRTSSCYYGIRIYRSR
jgi:S1-C subfamily serine protease